MTMPRRLLVFTALLSLLLPACREQPVESHEDIVRAGLAEILSHQETDCGEVISWEVDVRFDYLVKCGDGVTYRIHVGKEGRVNVE